LRNPPSLWDHTIDGRGEWSRLLGMPNYLLMERTGINSPAPQVNRSMVTTPSFGQVWNATCVVGVRIFYGEDDMSRMQRRYRILQQRLAWISKNRTAGPRRDQRVRVVRRQRQFGIVEHLDMAALSLFSDVFDEVVLPG